MTILDGLDRSSVEFVAKSQLRAYGQFLQEFHDSVKNSTDGIPVVEAAPILVNPTPRESCSLRDLVRSGNVVLDKIMTALVVVCREAALLKQEAEKKFYPALIIYGEGETVPSGGSSEASALTTMAEFLSLLQELSCFVERCSEVVRNIMWQLAGLYHNNPQPLVSMSDVHLPVVWEALAKVLSVLLTLDEIIARQPYLKEHFELYLKSARLVHHNPKKFALDETRLKFLDNLLAKLDAQIMSGFILQNCADQPFDTDSMHVNRNSALMEEFAWIIKHFYSRADARLGDLGDREQCWLLTGTSGLYVLYLCIFRTLDKKLFKLLWQSFKKVSAIPLIGDIMWSPCDFLYRKVPESEKVVDKRTLQTPLLQCSEYLTTKTQSLSKECQTLTLQVTGWLAQLANFKTWSVNVNAELDVRSNHILTGLRLAFYIGRLVQFILNGHALEKRPLSKQAADSVFRLIELLKAIENEVYRRWMIILETVTHVSQRMTGTLLSLVTSAKESVRSDKKKSNRNVDMLAALLLGQNALSGPPTEERLLVLALALQFGGYGKILKSDDLAAASNLLDKLDLLTHLDAKFRDACSCSCLLLHRTIFPSYFESALKSAADADRMQYFFCGLNDCLTALNAARHTKVDQLKQKFEDDFANIFQTNFLEKLYESIENDLRLCIHTHLQLEDRNPFVVQLRVHTPILHVPALRLGNRYIDIKRCVEQYLERTFYNLTTVALHDWRTYAEMRQLAKQKYGLDLVDPHLPSQTLEQGLDVLEIMRNIHIFVAKYLYNLNNQVFIEHTSNNKHLNVLNIRHIANSIRTHGTGIMSTTVNFTYQFLRKKFYVFSQFLYDDHIKSKLIKDVRYFREHKEKLGGMFPFEKAEKFNRSIRKLGLTPDGLSYFDQFRQLITQIGNALGYVRMVRSGGLQACAQAIQFIPDLDDVVPFAPLVDEKASAETKGAAQAFDTLVGNLIKNFTTGTEYFKLFVEVFAPEFRNQKHVHLKNFYILVPALTVNFVEHVTACKEKINRKGQEGAAFTDDGFSMGVAYILKLLDQYDEFDSLHWFRSVKEKYAKEKDEVEKQQRGETSGGADVKLSQTLTLTMKRIEHYSREFDLVSFSLRSARVFFRTDALLELIPKEKDISDSKMKVNDVLQCSFNSWYGQFSNVTIESVVIPLPSDVVQYLTADGIFVGGYSNDGEMEAAACAGESEVGEMANGEALSAAFKAQVERSIRQVGGEVFPKLNWSSPKDATWITPGHSLKCTNVDEVFILLKSSDFVVHDLTEPFLECEDVGFPVPCIPYTLVLRRWMDLDRCNEFRCFVKDEYLVAICQRHVDSYFRSLAESEDYKAQLVNVVSSFFQANIKPKFPLTRYTFDVYVDGDKVLLLDFNPWGIVTDSFLFSWQELDSIAPSKSDEAAAANAWRPELRVITDKTIRSPGVFSGVYGVPLEYHRLAMAAQEGKAPYETLLELMEAQNLSDEEEMDNR